VKCPFLSENIPFIGIVPRANLLFYLYRIYGIKKLELKTSPAGLKEGLCSTLTSSGEGSRLFSSKKNPWRGYQGQDCSLVMVLTAFLWTEPKRIWLIK